MGQREKITVIYYMNVIKRKMTWQSQSIDTEKAFVKAQNLFMIEKKPNNLCMNRNKLSRHDKSSLREIYQKHT